MTGTDQSYRQDRVVLVQGGDAVECGQAGATGAWVLQDGRCDWNFHDSMCWMNIGISPKWNFPNSPPKFTKMMFMIFWEFLDGNS